MSDESSSETGPDQPPLFLELPVPFETIDHQSLPNPDPFMALAERDELDETVADAFHSLIQRIETLEREQSRLEETLDDIEEEHTELEEEIDDLESRLKHKQADFQNYKKRAKKRQEQIEQRATKDLLERLLDVRDNLNRALTEESDDVESLKEGVRMTLSAFDRVLDAENVEKIDPNPGSEVDPTRHEVMMRVESDVPADRVAEQYRPGYEMEGTVLRPAQVTVSDGPTDGEPEEEASTAE